MPRCTTHFAPYIFKLPRFVRFSPPLSLAGDGVFESCPQALHKTVEFAPRNIEIGFLLLTPRFLLGPGLEGL